MMISLAIHNVRGEEEEAAFSSSRLEEKRGRMVSTIEQDKLALSIRGLCYGTRRVSRRRRGGGGED